MTLSGATASAGTAPNRKSQPGNPPATEIARQVSSIPTTVAPTRASTSENQVSGSANASGGSQDSTSRAVQTSTTTRERLKPTLGSGSPWRASTIATAPTRATAVHTPPTSTRPMTSATSEGETEKVCRRNSMSSWTDSVSRNAANSASTAHTGGVVQALGSVSTPSTTATDGDHDDRPGSPDRGETPQRRGRGLGQRQPVCREAFPAKVTAPGPPRAAGSPSRGHPASGALPGQARAAVSGSERHPRDQRQPRSAAAVDEVDMVLELAVVRT